MPTTTTPRVTIGIPVFNASRTLPSTLRSIFCQTFPHWELILVDDGSTDGSVEMMRGLRDPRVRIITHGDNRGAGPRLNEISREAKAPLIARMDADDVMHPERLERQVAFMESHPDVEVVGTGVYSIDRAYRIHGRRGRSTVPDSDFSVALRGIFIHPSVMGRTSWFLENPYDESARAKRAEDAELWLRTFRRSTFALVPDPLLFYMENADDAIKKLRSTNAARIRLMYTGEGEIRRKPLRLRAPVTAVICVKMAIYELLSAVGRQDYLIARRNRVVPKQEAEQAYQCLQYVRSYPVPGLQG